MKVIVASTNPVKIAAARSGFNAMFPEEKWTFEGQAVPSGVSDQPMSDSETWQGAYNRAWAAFRQFPQAHFWVGIEGGISLNQEKLMAYAWLVIVNGQRQGEARTASFVLPEAVASLIHEGRELGAADDQVFGTADSKKHNGAVGLLSRNAITRSTLYAPAVSLALIPFLPENQGLYQPLDASTTR